MVERKKRKDGRERLQPGPKAREIYLDAQYEIIIPHNLRNMQLTPMERAKWREELAAELLVYYKTGVAKLGISNIYTPKQLRIKRIIWLCGGCQRVMAACHLSRSAISRWIERENIIPKYWPVLVKLLDNKISVGDIAKAVIGD